MLIHACGSQLSVNDWHAMIKPIVSYNFHDDIFSSCLEDRHA
jgi:hypothetical protein